MLANMAYWSISDPRDVVCMDQIRANFGYVASDRKVLKERNAKLSKAPQPGGEKVGLSVMLTTDAANTPYDIIQIRETSRAQGASRNEVQTFHWSDRVAVHCVRQGEKWERFR